MKYTKGKLEKMDGNEVYKISMEMGCGKALKDELIKRILDKQKEVSE